MQALKALVIGMGVLIAAGVGLVVYAVVERMAAPEAGPGPEAGRAPVASGSNGAAATEAEIALPAGAEIVETRLDGARVAFRLRLADGAERLEVYELATGRRLATLAIRRGGDGGGGDGEDGG